MLGANTMPISLAASVIFFFAGGVEAGGADDEPALVRAAKLKMAEGVASGRVKSTSVEVAGNCSRRCSTSSIPGVRPVEPVADYDAEAPDTRKLAGIRAEGGAAGAFGRTREGAGPRSNDGLRQCPAHAPGRAGDGDVNH